MNGEFIDYLDIAEGKHVSGSRNALIKEFVDAVRHMRTQVPIEQTADVMPAIRRTESELQSFDTLGEPDRCYFDEVWKTLEDEPDEDDSQVFMVFEVGRVVDEDFLVLGMPLATFYHRRSAVRWIKEKAESNKQYVIQEVFKT